MDSIRTQITDLIEEYERDVKELKNTVFIEPTAADIAEGALNELERVIVDLKRVRDAVDVYLSV